MEKLKKLFNKYITNDFRLALFIVIIWKFVMILVGFFIDTSLNNQPGILDHTNHWDAGWYSFIINGGYEKNPSAAAFYPLFPLLVSILSIGPVSVLLAGQIVNTLSVFFIIFGLLKLSSHFNVKHPLVIVGLVLISPAAFFLHVFYSEALFFALGVWAYVFALRHRWFYCCILLGLLTACRLPSLLFVALCGLEYLHSYKWDMKQIFNKQLANFLIVPVGFICYAVFLNIKTGNALAMFAAYKTNEWSYQIFNINFIETYLKNIYQIFRSIIGIRPIDIELLVNIYAPAIMLSLLLFSSIYLILKRNNNQHFLPLGVFGILSFIMFTLNSNVVSAHRYILPCLTIYFAIYNISKGKKQLLYLAPFFAIGACIQFLLFSLFITNIFAG